MNVNELNRCQPLLGTFVELRLSGDHSEQALIKISECVFREVKRIHDLMSFHDHTSELSYINKNAYIKSCRLSKDMHKVLELALTMSRQSGGVFDISIAPELIDKGLLPAIHSTDQCQGDWRDIVIQDQSVRFQKKLLIDLGGIAKGYAADCGMAMVPEGVNAVINAGGDLVMRHWQGESIHIQDPEQRHCVKHVDMKAPALATSTLKNNLQRDIIAKQECTTTERPLSVSVFAHKCVLADALTKIMLLDINNTNALKSFSASALYVDANGAMHHIDGAA